MNSHVRFEAPGRAWSDQQESGGAHDRASRAQGQRLLRVVASDELFRGTTEIGIEHGGAMYRLKITRQGKLILNK